MLSVHLTTSEESFCSHAGLCRVLMLIYRPKEAPAAFAVVTVFFEENVVCFMFNNRRRSGAFKSSLCLLLFICFLCVRSNRFKNLQLSCSSSAEHLY